MATMVTNPPAAAARLPVAMSSRSSRPGVRRWTCGSTKPGTATSPAASISSSPSGEPPTRPSRRTRSRTSSSPAAGSRTRTPRSTSDAAGPGRWTSRGHQTATAPIWSAGSAAPAGSVSRSYRTAMRTIIPLAACRTIMLAVVGEGARDLDAAVDRAGVHHPLAGAQAVVADPVGRGVLAQRRDEAARSHPLQLHPQHVDDVGVGDVAHVGGDVHPERRLGLARDQRRRGDQRDARAHRLEAADARARDARVGDVPTKAMCRPSSGSTSRSIV